MKPQKMTVKLHDKIYLSDNEAKSKDREPKRVKENTALNNRNGREKPSKKVQINTNRFKTTRATEKIKSKHRTATLFMLTPNQY